MGIFDQIDEITAREEDDKNRLFETHDKAGKSFWVYEKFFIPIVLLVLVGVGMIFYLDLPGAGQKVRPEQDLYDAVYDHMLTQEKRTATDMEFYYCESFYTVEITVEPRTTAPNKPADISTNFKAVARKDENGTWQVKATALGSGEKAVPCRE